MKAPLRALILIVLIWSGTCQVSAQWVQTTFPSEYFTTAFGVSGSTIFVGTRGQGIFRSTDDGAHWEAVNNGLGTDTTVSAFGVHGSSIYAGTGTYYESIGPPRGAIYVSTNAGTSWQAVDTSRLAGTIITSFAFDDSGGYAGTLEDSAGQYFTGMLSSSDGKQWTGVPFPRTFGVISSLLIHNSEVFAGHYNSVVFFSGPTLLRSTNGGATWEGLVGPPLDCLALASAGQSIFAASERTLYLSNDEGSIWNEVGAGLLDTMYNHNGHPGAWFNSLLVQSDGSTGNLNLFVGAVLSGPGGGNLGTGIFLSIDKGATWKEVDDGGLGFADPFQIQVIAATSTSLFVRSGQRGIWRRPLKEMTTSIGNAVDPLPHENVLHQNYPNPFNPSTQITYTVAGGKENGVGNMDVKLVVYDLLGREVATLVHERQAPGSYTVRFNAGGYASGVYLYRLEAGGFTETKKLTLVK